MIGAIIGDIVGSPYEFNNTHDYKFPWLSPESTFTDDTICTIAIADAINKAAPGENPDYAASLLHWCRKYPNPKGGYGGRFAQWIRSETPEPYGSFGNGSAMRVSPIAWAYTNLHDVLQEARNTASVTHNHPEGIKGAVCIAHMIWAARHTASIDQLDRIASKYYPSWDSVSREYGIFDETCQGTLPVCFWAILSAYSFEDAIRKAIAYGGDSDTIGAIVGSVAEAIWDIPEELRIPALSRLPRDMRNVIEKFYDTSLRNPDGRIMTAIALSNDRHTFHRMNERLGLGLNPYPGLGDLLRKDYY